MLDRVAETADALRAGHVFVADLEDFGEVGVIEQMTSRAPTRLVLGVGEVRDLRAAKASSSFRFECGITKSHARVPFMSTLWQVTQIGRAHV